MGRYQKPVYNAAFGVLHRAEDAKDITQDVFLKVVDRLNEYDPKYKFFSWIYRIALNESSQSAAAQQANRIRGMWRPAWRVRSDSPILRIRSETSNSASEYGALLMRMSENDRTVLFAATSRSAATRRIGQILDLDEKTVKSRLFESRQRCAGCWPTWRNP